MAATAGACCWSIAFRSSSPPISPSKTLRAVDRDDERVAVFHAAHVAGAGETADVQLVLAVGRKQMLDEEPAARAERQPIDVRALIRAPRRTIRGAARAVLPDCRAPARSRRAPPRCTGRETTARRVRTLATLSKPSASSSLGRSALASTRRPSSSSMAFGVLRAVEPMQRHAARIGMRRGRLVERALEPGHEAVHARLVGPPRTGRRHHPAAQLANGLLPDVGVRRQSAEVQRVEREAGRLRALVVARRRSTRRAAHACRGRGPAGDAAGACVAAPSRPTNGSEHAAAATART